jgi:predicted Rossmann fold nucleotide-binding protein DprA/Smf involved in DNA uptake
MNYNLLHLQEMKECKIALVLFSEDPFESTTTIQTSKQKIYLKEPQQLRKWKSDENNLIKQQMTFIRNTGANVECVIDLYFCVEFGVIEHNQKN